MERDLVGYGAEPPVVPWPNGARLAVQISLNYEEGAEHSLLDGPTRESMGEVPSPVPPDRRDLYNESMFEYGSRVGVWRLLRTLGQYDVPATWWACALALERNPAVARAAAASGHEIAGHGYRWEEFHGADRDAERETIRRTVASLATTTGQRPLGWWTRYACSPHTRELLVEEGGFVYDSLALNDDLPYYVRVAGRSWLVVPYTFEINDARFWRGGLVGVGDFEEYMRAAFDCLYAEGEAGAPKMLSVGLHCRLVGRPARQPALARFLLEEMALMQPVAIAGRTLGGRLWLSFQGPLTPGQRQRIRNFLHNLP
jgi:peptidoglycan/xylan/chitin deacetylase (PgdA/CDA1 family)